MRTIKTITLGLTALASASVLTACSGGMSTAAGMMSSTSGGNGSQSTGGTTPGADLQSVDLKSYVDGGTYDKTQSFDFNKTTGVLTVRVPLGMDMTVPLVQSSITQFPDITFGTETAGDGTINLVVNVPVKYILHGVTTLPSSSTLPDGSAFPGLPAGEMPFAAFNLRPTDTTHPIYLYMGLDAVAVYVKSPWLTCGSSLPICPTVTVPVRNSDKTKIVGYFSVMGGKNNNPGGFFVSMQMPIAIATILDEYFVP